MTTEMEQFEEWLEGLSEPEISEWTEDAHSSGKSLFQFWQMGWTAWGDLFPPRQIDPPRDTGLGDEFSAYDAGVEERSADWSAPFWKGAKS